MKELLKLILSIIFLKLRIQMRKGIIFTCLLRIFLLLYFCRNKTQENNITYNLDTIHVYNLIFKIPHSPIHLCLLCHLLHLDIPKKKTEFLNNSFTCMYILAGSNKSLSYLYEYMIKKTKLSSKVKFLIYLKKMGF